MGLNGQGSSPENFPHKSEVSRCIFVIEDPLVAGKMFGSFSSNFFMQPFQYLQIVNLVDSLSSWYKFVMSNNFNIIKKVSNIILTLDSD